MTSPSLPGGAGGVHVNDVCNVKCAACVLMQTILKIQSICWLHFSLRGFICNSIGVLCERALVVIWLFKSHEALTTHN